MLSSAFTERPILGRNIRPHSIDLLAEVGCLALLSGLGWMLLKAIVQDNQLDR